MGAFKDNKVIEEFIKFIKLNNKNLTDSIKLSNDLNVNCHKQVTNNKMAVLEATKIGTKKTDGKPLVMKILLLQLFQGIQVYVVYIFLVKK